MIYVLLYMYVTTDFGLLCGCVIEKRRGEIEKRLFNDIICLVYISSGVKKNHQGCAACSFMHIHLYGDASDFWRCLATNGVGLVSIHKLGKVTAILHVAPEDSSETVQLQWLPDSGADAEGPGPRRPSP